MLLDVEFVFRYCDMCGNVYADLLRQCPRFGDRRLMGTRNKALYDTRDAPHMLGPEVEQCQDGLGVTHESTTTDSA